MKRALLTICLVAVATTVSPAQAAERISLSGQRGEDGRFELRFEYEAGEFSAERSMILVTSQPSNRTLVAHLRPGLLRQSGGGDLAATAELVSEGSMDRIAIVANLAVGPAQKEDSSIVVLAVKPNGEKFVLADARVDTEWFEFTTSYLEDRIAESPEFLRNNCSSGQWHHCCRGQDCSQVCTCCNGPSFFCNAIGQECTIECLDQ